jgi:CspA family cold shock protein
MILSRQDFDAMIKNTCWYSGIADLGLSLTSSNDTLKDAKMATGTVKWFNTQKGYGFIVPDEGGKDIFVHISAVERSGLRTLNEGQKVEFELQNDKGKTAAVNIKAV